MTTIVPEETTISTTSSATSSPQGSGITRTSSALNSDTTGTPSTPNSGITEAWTRRKKSKQSLLRFVEVIGWVLGHGPGTLRSQRDDLTFSYLSLRTAYVVVLIIFVSCIQIYAIVRPLNGIGVFAIAADVAAVTPHYVDAILFYLIAAFNLTRAKNIKMTFSDIHKLSDSTRPPSFMKQFTTFSLWVVFVVIVIARVALHTVQLLSVESTAFSFRSFIIPFVSVYVKLYMTWLLEVYILVCLHLRERQLQLRQLMMEAITPEREGLWNLLDSQTIEGAICQHRKFSQEVSRYFDMMSPALFVLMTSFFVNEAFGLYTFMTNMVFIDGILRPLPLIELSFLFFYFVLVFATCHVSSSLSDQWCFVGQDVTGVPICRVTEQIRVQLLTFLQQLPDQVPVVTGGGFFIISKSLLLTIMNVIATYLIFAVQIHNA